MAVPIVAASLGCFLNHARAASLALPSFALALSNKLGLASVISSISSSSNSLLSTVQSEFKTSPFSNTPGNGSGLASFSTIVPSDLISFPFSKAPGNSKTSSFFSINGTSCCDSATTSSADSLFLVVVLFFSLVYAVKKVAFNSSKLVDFTNSNSRFFLFSSSTSDKYISLFIYFADVFFSKELISLSCLVSRLAFSSSNLAISLFISSTFSLDVFNSSI